MTLRNLEIFVEVYRQESITKASENLYMTQPAVTRAIKDLESYYDVQLFERYKRHLHKTKAADQLYSRAVHIIESLNMLDKELLNWDETGTIRIGATITLGNIILPDLIMGFRELRPKLDVQVRIINGMQLKKHLYDNTLDLALIEGASHDEQLVTIPFRKDRLVLVADKANPLAQKKDILLEDIVGEKLILREPGSVGRSFVDMVFNMRGLPVIPAWESASTQAIMKAVACGIGVSILPLELVDIDRNRSNVVARDISDADFSRDNHIVFHKNKHLSPALQLFINLCRTSFQTSQERCDVF